MSPDGRIKLVSELLDLPLIDSEGKYCGIVDDLELKGSAGKPLRLQALLIGPGAYRGRMPGWLMALVRALVGDRVVSVPVGKVRTIGAAVRLDKTEARAGRWIPQKGAL